MKDDNGTLSKMDLIETITKCLKENGECMSSSLRLPRGSHGHLDDVGLLENQQEGLEVKTMPKLCASELVAWQYVQCRIRIINCSLVALTAI